MTRRKGTFIKAEDAQKDFELPLIGYVFPCKNATDYYQFAPCVEIKKGYLVTGKLADGTAILPAWNIRAVEKQATMKAEKKTIELGGRSITLTSLVMDPASVAHKKTKLST